MKDIVYNFEGSTDFSAAKDCYVTIRSTGEFYVLNESKDILGPDHVNDRVFRVFLQSPSVSHCKSRSYHLEVR